MLLADSGSLGRHHLIANHPQVVRGNWLGFWWGRNRLQTGISNNFHDTLCAIRNAHVAVPMLLAHCGKFPANRIAPAYR